MDTFFLVLLLVFYGIIINILIGISPRIFQYIESSEQSLIKDGTQFLLFILISTSVPFLLSYYVVMFLMCRYEVEIKNPSIEVKEWLRDEMKFRHWINHPSLLVNSIDVYNDADINKIRFLRKKDRFEFLIKWT